MSCNAVRYTIHAVLSGRSWKHCIRNIILAIVLLIVANQSIIMLELTTEFP